MFEVRWEFEIRPEARDEFVATYGPTGDWVKLFKQGAGFLGTTLSQVGPANWITVDRWDSRESFAAFRAAHHRAYAELDARCAHLTHAERRLDERESRPPSTRTGATRSDRDARP